MGSKQLVEDVAVNSQKNLVSEGFPQLALTLRRIDNARLSKTRSAAIEDTGTWAHRIDLVAMYLVLFAY